MNTESKKSSWVRYIQNRIKNNKNFLGFVSGQTGSGKSYSSLQLCYECDPNFTVGQVVFNGLELMELITSKKLKSGSAICFEEIGVAMDARQWQSKTNRLLTHLIETFRHRNYILIFNSPYMDYVDSSIRKLFHAEFETTKIDKEKGVCILKPKLIQYNSKLKKFYYKRLRIFTPNGLVPIDRLPVKKPPQEVLVWYENRKKAYSHELEKNIYNELKQIHDKQTKKKKLTEKQKLVYELSQKGMTQSEISKEIGVNHSFVNRMIQMIRKKGYEVTNKYVTYGKYNTKGG